MIALQNARLLCAVQCLHLALPLAQGRPRVFGSVRAEAAAAILRCEFGAPASLTAETVAPNWACSSSVAARAWVESLALEGA